MMKEPIQGVAAGLADEGMKRLNAALVGVVDMAGGCRDLASVHDLVERFRPSAVFVDPSDDRTLGIDICREMTRAHPDTKVFIVGGEKDPDLILAGFRSGIADFIPLGDNGADARSVVLGAMERSDAKEPGFEGKVTGVFSLKGGQGVTSLAVNLADHMNLLVPDKVALIDLNLYMGDSALMLACSPAYTPFDLARDMPRMDENLFFSSATRHSRGFYLLATATEIADPDRISPGQVTSALSFMRRHLAQVVIDLPHDFNERTVAAMEAADRLLVVVQQTTPVLKNARSTLQLFDELGFDEDRVKIVVNRFTGQSELGREDLEYVLQRPVFAEIRNDYESLRRAVNSGQTLDAAAPDRAVNTDLSCLAEKLTGVSANRDKADGVARRLMRRLGLMG